MAAAYHTSAILCASRTAVELVPDLKLTVISCQMRSGNGTTVLLAFGFNLKFYI